jgi:hypothetical protein
MKNWSYIFFLFSVLVFAQTDEIYGLAVIQNYTIRTFGEGKPLLVINGGPGMNSDGFTFISPKSLQNIIIKRLLTTNEALENLCLKA